MKTIITVTEQSDDEEMPHETARAELVQDDRLVTSSRQKAVLRILLQEIREKLGLVRSPAK